MGRSIAAIIDTPNAVRLGIATANVSGGNHVAYAYRTANPRQAIVKTTIALTGVWVRGLTLPNQSGSAPSSDIANMMRVAPSGALGASMMNQQKNMMNAIQMKIPDPCATATKNPKKGGTGSGLFAAPERYRLPLEYRNSRPAMLTSRAAKIAIMMKLNTSAPQIAYRFLRRLFARLISPPCNEPQCGNARKREK